MPRPNWTRPTDRKRAKPLPGDLRVAWVLRCPVGPQTGGVRYLVMERSDSDLAALLAALRAPAEARSKGFCPMLRCRLPYFALIQPGGRRSCPGCRSPAAACRRPAVLDGAQRAAIHGARAAALTGAAPAGGYSQPLRLNTR